MHVPVASAIHPESVRPQSWRVAGYKHAVQWSGSTMASQTTPYIGSTKTKHSAYTSTETYMQHPTEKKAKQLGTVCK